MNQQNLEKLRLELSVQAKNGVDFILSASIIWFGIAWLWTLSFSRTTRACYFYYWRADVAHGIWNVENIKNELEK